MNCVTDNGQEVKKPEQKKADIYCKDDITNTMIVSMAKYACFRPDNYYLMSYYYLIINKTAITNNIFS